MRKTPRGIAFCWHCSKKLYGDHYALALTDQGQEVVVHKQCKEKVERNRCQTKTK